MTNHNSKKLFGCITVRELIERLSNYVKNDPSKLDDNVMIVDDWTPPKYYNVNTALGSVFEREVKPAYVKIENDIPYQEEPPEYKSENVFLIVTNLFEEQK